MEIRGWVVKEAGKPLEPWVREEEPRGGEVLVEVAGCGVCHTDLGFYYDGVPTRKGFPLVLGHEIAGRVVAAGPGAEDWVGRAVVVPAVLPCGDCPACRAGRGSICPEQIFPGNDDHGGFATHVKVPAKGLCEVRGLDEDRADGLTLADLSVIADAVSTPYQAIQRSGLRAGDLAVFVGVGGVGGFGVQIAAALGAAVAAVDVDPDRLEAMRAHGAQLCLDARSHDPRSLKKEIRAFGKERGVPTWRRFVFETSGTPAGQRTAFGLLEHGGYLSVVGYTKESVEIRLSNLMALDAKAEGNWGCLPELYPEVLGLVLEGRVKLGPFVEHRPLSEINEVFAAIHRGAIKKRVVLRPDLDG